MILYSCRKCGKWQDVSLTQSLQKAFLDGMFANAPAEQKNALMDANVFDCPDGHGPMQQVQTNERIMVWERLDEKGSNA